MKTLVIYYSYTGHTRKIASELAKGESADLYELQEKARRSTLSAYVLGSFAAMRQKIAELKEFSCDLSAYDKIIIAAPIWAGYPATPFNNVMAALPSGKQIGLVMVSGSGSSKSCMEKIKSQIAAKGCEVVSYQDIKA